MKLYKNHDFIKYFILPAYVVKLSMIIMLFLVEFYLLFFNFTRMIYTWFRKYIHLF